MSHFDQLRKEIRARDKIILKQHIEKKEWHKVIYHVIERSQLWQKKLSDLLLFGQSITTAEESEKLAKWAFRYANRLIKARGSK